LRVSVDDDQILTNLKEAFQESTECELAQIELYRENVNEVMADISAEAFSKVSLGRIPKDSRLKLLTVLRHRSTGCLISSISSISCQSMVLQQPKYIEIPEIFTRPGEVEAEGVVKRELVSEIERIMFEHIHFIVCRLNALISEGVVRLV